MQTKYSSEQLKKLIDDALDCDVSDIQNVKDSISEMIEQINVYHQELHYQNAELSDTISQLEIMKEKYQALFSDAPIGYVVFDRNDDIKEANNTFCQMMNMSSREIFHHKMSSFVLPPYQDEFYFLKNHVLDYDKQEVRELQMKASHKIYDVSIICKPFHCFEQRNGNYEEVDLICCAIMDISEMKMQQKKILDLSFHDAMTGLYNRRFFAHINKELAGYDVLPLSIATIDLDGLKIINDSLGHEYGDQAIVSVSSILKEQAEPNYILIRMGGDEIIILFPRTTKDEAMRYLSLCEKMIYARSIEGIPVSISYGVATKLKEKETIESISALSEDIMYSHKIVQSPRQKNYVVRQTITRLFEKHPKIQHHCERASQMMSDFATYLDMDAKMITKANKLGYIHDIGMVAIADPLVVNDDEFDDEERQEYQRHPQIGNRIIRSLFGYEDIAMAVLYHHEQWDGNGYPYGLKGTMIPLLSRMMMLVDQYDQLYHFTNSPILVPTTENVLEEMKKRRGIAFDPEMFDKFFAFMQEQDAHSQEPESYDIAFMIER